MIKSSLLEDTPVHISFNIICLFALFLLFKKVEGTLLIKSNCVTSIYNHKTLYPVSNNMEN